MENWSSFLTLLRDWLTEYAEGSVKLGRQNAPSQALGRKGKKKKSKYDGDSKEESPWVQAASRGRSAVLLQDGLV